MRNTPSLLLNVLLLSLAGLGAGTSQALPAPKYLAIAHFEQCLATQKQGSHQSWCLPARPGANCPAASWQQLQALGGDDRLPDCRLKSKGKPAAQPASAPAASASGPNTPR